MRRVVHRRDVIDVKGVTKAERVGERTQASESRMVAGAKPEQAPPQEVQQQDPASEGEHPVPLGAVKVRLRPCAAFSSGGRPGPAAIGACERAPAAAGYTASRTRIGRMAAVCRSKRVASVAARPPAPTIT